MSNQRNWRTSVLRELEALGGRKALAVDWVRFLDDGKAAYRPGMDKGNRGESPWTTVDASYRMRLGELVVAYGIRCLATEEAEAVTRAWQRLHPWPSAVPG